MKSEKKLARVFTGTEVQVNLLKSELEKEGIFGIIRNDFQSGVMAGFGAGVPSAIDLYIQEHDLERAEPVINEFIRMNEERGEE